MATLTEKAAALIAYLDRNATVSPKDTGQPTIAELLQQSRTAHGLYRRSLRHRANGVTIDGDPAAAAAALTAAARLRAEAEIADPQHADQAWADESRINFPHPALIDFYGDQIAAVVPPVIQPAPEPKPVDIVSANAETR